MANDCITINLNSLKEKLLTESYVAQFAQQIKYLLRHIASPSLYDPATYGHYGVRVVGNKADLGRFANVMGHEKKYMDAYLKHGLGDPKVLQDRVALEKAIFRFEMETGLKWPLK